MRFPSVTVRSAWERVRKQAPWWAHRQLPNAPWVERFRNACLRVAPNTLKLKLMWAPMTLDWADIRFLRLVENHLPALRKLETARQHIEIRDLLLTHAVDARLLPEEMRPIARAASPSRPPLIADGHLGRLALETRALIALVRKARGVDLADQFPMLSAVEITVLRARTARGRRAAARNIVIPPKVSPTAWLLARRDLGSASRIQRRLDSRAVRVRAPTP